MTATITSIRLIELADAPALASHLALDAREFSRWDPPRPKEFRTTQGQVSRIEQLLDIYDKAAGWPGVILADGAVIGQVTVSTILRGPFQKGFLGYWVVSNFQNQGHATRAVGLALQVMTQELGLYRAEAHTRMENLASQRVLKANGFTPWGIAHAHIYLDGAWRDEVFWERALASGTPPQ